MGLTEREIRKDFEEYKFEKKQIVEEDLPIQYTTLRKVTRPIQRGLLWGQRMIKGQRIHKMGDFHYKIPKNTPVIFVVSHIGKYDFEIVNELIKEQFYVLASDYYNMHGNFNEWMMNWFGVYFVDELDKEDKYYTSEIVKKTLEEGNHSMILAEGTWNLSPNEIIMDTHYGSVDIAMSKKALILPISLEQYEKEFYVHFGKFFDPNEIASQILLENHYQKTYQELNIEEEKEYTLKQYIKHVTNTMMRDALASLKLAIWSSFPVEHRGDIPEHYWEEFIEKRKKEWKGYSMDEQFINTVLTKEKKEHRDVIHDFISLSLKHPNIVSASDLSYYLDQKEQNLLIEESLLRLREEMEHTPIEPIEVRLQKYKEKKKKMKLPKKL